MPSKKWNKGRGGGVRHRLFWHKTNWREENQLYDCDLRRSRAPPAAFEEEEDEEQKKFLQPAAPIKRAKSESDGSVASTRSHESDTPLPVYLLSDLASLVEEVPPGAFVILDIDETIIMTRGAPSFLLTKEGVDTFRAIVHKRVDDWKEKNAHCQRLQKALKDKIPVTPHTAATIQALQGNGVFVCGLTARYSEFAKVTEKELEGIGVNLGLESPFPACLEDKELRITIQNGVIYCNNQDKGSVLREVLERHVFKEALKKVRGLAASSESVEDNDVMLIENQKSAIVQGCGVPPEIFFVDDLYANALSVCGNLTPLSDELGIVVSCYHYVPEQLAGLHSAPVRSQCQSDGKTPTLEQRILVKQVETFFDKQLVLSNEQAKQLLA